MVGAFLLALAQLGDRRMLGLLGRCALLGVAVFAALWLAVGWLLAQTSVTTIGWLDTALDVLGGLATLALTWLLFPAVLAASVGLFLEPVAAAVEARHHPHLPPAPGLPWWTTLGASLRFLAVALVVNLLLLALLAWPPVHPFAYVTMNGWLVGREYVELVALRRGPPAAARALRAAHRGELLVFGVVVTALLAVPVANLLVPVVATAAMVHRVQAWRRGTPAQGAGGG